jgi:16S rRNA (guanine1207-N2)-methyltransferase
VGETRQYFSKTNDDLPSNEKIIYAKINDSSFKFKTDNGVFSKDFLDFASKLLLEKMDYSSILDGQILDVGCGYGPIGIYLAHKTKRNVVMLDINPRALSLSKENLKLNNVEARVLESDCLEAVLDEKFSCVITNPPIHAGKEVVYKIYEQSYEVLIEGGSLWIIIQEKHGAPSSIKKLKTLFNVVETYYKKKGFYILKCVK